MQKSRLDNEACSGITDSATVLLYLIIIFTRLVTLQSCLVRASLTFQMWEL